MAVRETTQELIRVRHEEFAHRAKRRLEEVADRLEGEARGLGLHGGASKTAARAAVLRGVLGQTASSSRSYSGGDPWEESERGPNGSP